MRTAQGAAANSYEADRRKYAESQSISEKTLKRVAVIAGLMLAAFLAGYVPSWLSASGYEYERAQLQKEARRSEMRHTLANAALSADRGQYEQALLKASGFFNALRAEHDSGEEVFPGASKESIENILARRDETIAMLARGEPAASERLADWYFELAKIEDER